MFTINSYVTQVQRLYENTTFENTEVNRMGLGVMTFKFTR